MNTRKPIRVAVNGYGVIGKRVADAVTKQKDMQLAGVVDVVADWRPRWRCGAASESAFAALYD